jgi:hypothetical protein
LVCHIQGRTQIEGVENRMLRRMFRLRSDEVTIGWQKMHNEELHNMYSSQNIIRIIASK